MLIGFFWSGGGIAKLATGRCLGSTKGNKSGKVPFCEMLSVSHELGRLIFVGYMAGISKSLGGISGKLVFCINGIDRSGILC